MAVVPVQPFVDIPPAVPTLEVVPAEEFGIVVESAHGVPVVAAVEIGAGSNTAPSADDADGEVSGDSASEQEESAGSPEASAPDGATSIDASVQRTGRPRARSGRALVPAVATGRTRWMVVAPPTDAGIAYLAIQSSTAGPIQVSVSELGGARSEELSLDGVDLEVERGAAFGLIGQNGAGKTTFIKLMLSIARPTSGALQLLGGDPHDPSVRRRVGYLPERLDLPPFFTPVACLKSIARLKGMSTAEADAGIPRVLRWVGLEEEAWGRKVGRFSKGMKQRTGLAAALLGDPDILVLDEPTNHLDIPAKQMLEDALRDYEGAALLVSHDRYFISRVANRIVELRDGELVLYRGDYAYYLEKKEEERAAAAERDLAATKEAKRKANREKQKARDARRKKAA